MALSVESLVEGVRGRDRATLARAITLVESRLSTDEVLAGKVLQQLLPDTGHALRVGISGVPGVGKSTLIESLGIDLLGQGHRVAVLAVDPTSSVSGGSILGDKTRMVELSRADNAFVRPSPSALTLGGVARRTRESMLLCEAAGFDVVIVETVGVGQSETAVADMVDTFVLLALPGAGDELQGIKRGIVELADIVAINKADGNQLPLAREAKREYSAALRYWPRRSQAWKPEVAMVSALERTGIAELWEAVKRHRAALTSAGELEALRRAQNERWLWTLVEDGLLSRFRRHPAVKASLEDVRLRTTDGLITASQGAAELLARFLDDTGR